MNTNTIDPKPLPEVGKFPIELWADLFDCSVATINNNIKQYSIPTFQCGGGKIIDAALWWKAAPMPAMNLEQVSR